LERTFSPNSHRSAKWIISRFPFLYNDLVYFLIESEQLTSEFKERVGFERSCTSGEKVTLVHVRTHVIYASWLSKYDMLTVST
jgi:hypothetical protein